VPFNEVDLKDRFWLPRMGRQARTLVPVAFERTEPAVDNLRKTAAFLQGDKSSLPIPSRYIASDLYKVMEGASYLLKEEPDPALEHRMDEIIDIIAAAQQGDGYLYEAHITGVSKDHPHWGPIGMGDKPYSWEVHSHELYDVGHMYEAAVAYYQATGKDKLLKVAEKNAQHVNRVFFVGDPGYNGGKPVNQAPGHQEIELALVKLYQCTGNRLYLQMAKRFLDIRGVTYVPTGPEPEMAPTYAQQHLPVAQQEEAVGHAVRAGYMYSSMADVGALSATHEYDHALRSVWHNIVDRKMHIIGGLGAIMGHEGFGRDYELPNKNTYNETCAAVANVLFNFRMFLSTRDGQFMDVAEVALLNNALAGTNLAGDKFFYVNPLEADGKTPFNHGSSGRASWFTTACCPTNLARLIPQVPGLMYSHAGDDVYVTLYASNSAMLKLHSGNVRLEQQSDYPFDGRIALTVQPARAMPFRLHLRVPTWARSDRFVPGDLYHYVHQQHREWHVLVNDKPANVKLEAGFAVLDRTWQPGDRVTLSLPMQVHCSVATEQVVEDRGRVAFTRGPLVYCAEAADNGDALLDLQLSQLPSSTEMGTSAFSDGALAGIVAIQVPAKSVTPVNGTRHPLVLIPYYAWDNRGDGSMLVWLPTNSPSRPS
jgi:hypothetical protein